MAKTKNQKQNNTKVLYLVIGFLLVTSMALVAVLCKTQSTGKSAEQSGVHVSLGAMEYSFESDKATRRKDVATHNLRAFLEQTGAKDIELGCTSTYYNVVRYTKDESQVLLKYGCEHPDAHMFAVLEGSTWRLISPTNQFDDLGMPKCDYVTQNHISLELAPVCVNGLGSSPDGQLHYVTR